MPSNLLVNHAFDQGLADWTGTGTISRSDGFPRAGCAQLATGQSISQVRNVSADQLYTLHYFYKLATGATLTVSYEGVQQTHSGAPVDVWREGVMVLSVDASVSGSVTFAASGGTVLLDTVSLIHGGLPVTRAQIASRVETELGAFATDQSLDDTPDSVGPEGDYTLAVDNALRTVGAVNAWGDPDVVKVETGDVVGVVEAATEAMLGRLRRIYALKTDVTLGPRSERLSQIAAAIGQQLDKGPGTVAVRKLRHKAEDFNL